MVADTKKVQSFVNQLADVADVVKDSSDTLEALRTAYQTANPDVTGTPLDGNLAAVNAWINDLTTLANSATATGMIAARVPSHRGKALD